MQTENRFLDDIARVAGGAFGALAGIRNEVEELVRQRLERFLADLDHVPREEFEAVKAMAEKARLEQETLAKRVAALETQLAAKKPSRARGAAASPKKSGAAKKPDAKPS